MPPQIVDDLPVYAGDPYTIRCNFKNPDGTPIDLTAAPASTFTAKARGGLELGINLSQAATGIVFLTLTGAQTETMLPVVNWDLAEEGKWGVTLLRGRLTKEGDVQ